MKTFLFINCDRFIYTYVIPNIMKEDKIVLIKVRESTREVLKRHGIKGETYDTIIQRLMDKWPEGERVLEHEEEEEEEEEKEMNK